MENRRLDYRHAFPPSRRLRVELSSSADPDVKVAGEIVNLSVGGMAVALPADLPSLSHSRYLARFALAGGQGLSIPAQPVHVENRSQPIQGFRFLSVVDAAEQERREKALWAFLLNEQWRERRERFRSAGAAPG